MLTVNEVKKEVNIKPEQTNKLSSILDANKTNKLTSNNTKFYSTFDSFGKFGYIQNNKISPSNQHQQNRSPSNPPMIKIVTPAKSTTKNTPR